MKCIRFLLSYVHKAHMQKRVNNSPPWKASWKSVHVSSDFVCLQKGDALHLWNKQPIRSPFLWIKPTVDRTQRSSVRFMDSLCPLQICDTEPWQGSCVWLWLQLNLLYKLSTAPGMALRYILYFSQAYLSVLRWCPIASMAMIMYMVSSVCPSDSDRL